MELTESMVTNYLRGDYKTQGNEIIAQCPLCKDSGKDNLKYNKVKNVLWCHACGDAHSKPIYAQIMKDNKPEPIKHTCKQYEIIANIDAYYLNQDEWNETLLADNDLLNLLYEKTMINPFTVKNCGIGFDKEDNKWVFPAYDLLDNKLKGFEYRKKDFSEVKKGMKCWKENDTPSCLCRIWGKSKNENLIICEGFKDAYIMAQWMNYPEKTTIVTPSNGVGSLEKLMPTIRLGDFKDIKLCLDNDEAGQKVLKAIIKDYSFVIDKTPKPKKGKDIGDLYAESRAT